MTSNPFTLSLLNYSADRDDSIGRPERWGSPPPLISSTPLHEEMEALAGEVWSGTPRAVWYFLVGGPGNGKSEAVGAFVRRINDNAQQAGKPAVFDARRGQHGGSVAYDFQESLPRGEIWLLQDVSVPMKPGHDPAEDLLACLELCAHQCVHLLACANRGMLLRATRLARKPPEKSWLVSLLEKIDRCSLEDSTPQASKWLETYNGKEIEIRVWPLDHESVLFGQGSGNPWAEPVGSLLDQIIQEAAAVKNWEGNGCSDCPAHELCPMVGDARWLRDDGRRHSLLKVLRYAEVLSGQRLVLREALGLVSLVLVGCTSDFVEAGNQLHPCDWVQNRVVPGPPPKPKDTRALIELIGHRVYQDLFARTAPAGLAIDRAHQHRDQWVIERLKLVGAFGESVAIALETIDGAFAKQAGPKRLVSWDGILTPFDPAKDNAWCAKHSVSVDGQVADLRQVAASHQEELERWMADLFQQLEDAAKTVAPHNDPAKAFAAVYRWASTLYLRLAGLALGETPNADSLSDFLSLLQNPARPIHAGGNPTMLRDLMRAAADSDQKAELAPGFVANLGSLQLRPVPARPRNTNPRWPANDRLVLQVSAGPGAGSAVLLTATTFVDAWRKHVLGVAEWNISPAVKDLMRAWRDDFVVSKGQFRQLQLVEFNGKSALEFEFISPTEIQVRPK